MQKRDAPGIVDESSGDDVERAEPRPEVVAAAANNHGDDDEEGQESVREAVAMNMDAISKLRDPEDGGPAFINQVQSVAAPKPNQPPPFVPAAPAPAPHTENQTGENNRTISPSIPVAQPILPDESKCVWYCEVDRRKLYLALGALLCFAVGAAVIAGGLCGTGNCSKDSSTALTTSQAITPVPDMPDPTPAPSSTSSTSPPTQSPQTTPSGNTPLTPEPATPEPSSPAPLLPTPSPTLSAPVSSPTPDPTTPEPTASPAAVPGGGNNVLLIDDQGFGFGTASTVLTNEGFNVTEVNSEFANGYATLLDADFLNRFDFVVYGERGEVGSSGSVLPQNVANSLESYLQQGGNLLVTGYDTLGGPTDTNVADLVRAINPGDQASGNPTWVVANIDIFILNGRYGDFRGQTFNATGYDDDRCIPDTNAGTLELVSTPGQSAKIIFNNLPDPAGSVGYWNGGRKGSTVNAQPDFSDGAQPQQIFLNWVDGVVASRA